MFQKTLANKSLTPCKTNQRKPQEGCYSLRPIFLTIYAVIHLDLTVHKDNLMLTTTHELYQPYTRNGTEDKNKSENKLIKDFFMSCRIKTRLSAF